jgi:hypothetical protein
MSAFMVGKPHIDAICEVALWGPSANGPLYPGHATWFKPRFGFGSERRLEFADLDELGAHLIEENLKSIHARYPDTVDNPESTPGPIARYWEHAYTFEYCAVRPNPVQALKLIDCYEYQSCEHEEWETSEVRAFCQRLRRSVIQTLPGYHDAPWEWTLGRQKLSAGQQQIEARIA